ncbi:MAG: sigma E positive regulator RseC/MucC [Methylomonas sp.]|nr:MAG: sigma E positive regulator RseC/MucC [Methylomonas sp.]
MIEEAAIVTRINNGQAWIKSLQSGACGGCMQQASCGTSTLAKLLPKREFAVEYNMALQVGDKVRIAIDDSHLLLSSLLLYLLPLLIMLSGVSMADAFLPSTVSVWLPEISLILLLLAFRLIHHFQNYLLIHLCFKPQILRKSIMVHETVA